MLKYVVTLKSTDYSAIKFEFNKDIAALDFAQIAVSTNSSVKAAIFIVNEEEEKTNEEDEED